MDSNFNKAPINNIEEEKSTPINQKKQLKAPLKVLLVFLVSLGLILTAFFGATTVIALGPSPAARDLFVSTVMETSAAKFLARIYFSEEKINAIREKSAPKTFDEITEAGSIVFGGGKEDFDLEAITIEDIVGPTYVGKMMIINDPSRIFVETVRTFDVEKEGETLESMLKRTGAIAGCNGGGFHDPGGIGKGGMPLGVVIQKGKIVLGANSSSQTVIGFDSEHKLIVGNMYGKEAVARGVQEALSFGPALVVNGKRMPFSETGGGLNPRTALGQREDGAVLILVIDGRQPHSLGAVYKDLADVMLDYGAVNAGNLDGGLSSTLYYKGELLNSVPTIFGPRAIPTAFLIK